MSLKFSNRAVLHYGGQESNLWNRFPQGAQPIASAPQNSAQPVIVYESNGKGHYALYHRNGWQKLSPFKDSKDGSVSWRMDGTEIPAVAWALPQRKR